MRMTIFKTPPPSIVIDNMSDYKEMLDEHLKCEPVMDAELFNNMSYMKAENFPKSKNVSDNVKMISGDTSGAYIVNLRGLDKKERKKFVNCVRFKDFLEKLEAVRQRLEKEQAARDATAKASSSEQTEPTSAKPAEQSPSAASEK